MAQIPAAVQSIIVLLAVMTKPARRFIKGRMFMDGRKTSS
jgi:hypothetical protein